MGGSLTRDVCKLALSNLVFDCCPVLLGSSKDRWGPTCYFKLMWLDEKNFPELNLTMAEGNQGWVGFRLSIKLHIMEEKING